MIAIRGAIRVERNERDEIFHRTGELLREIRDRNGLEEEDVVSAFFTMTPDLNADFPAYAAREMGWTDTAMLGAQESAVPGAMDRMVRVLVHAEVPGPARHVYLGDAAAMRPDLVEEGDASAAFRATAPERSRYGTLMVVGLGLVGGSAAMAVRKRGLFETVLGHDLDSSARRGARRAGAVDELAASAGEGVERADVVLLAVPVPALVGWLREWGGRLRRGAVVMDVGSTKREIVRAMEGLPEGVEAVGGHPMSGSEQSGIGAARPDLFHGAPWALVETGRTGERAREVAEAVVAAVGARPLWTDGPADHDRGVAATSHLPYLLSAALALHLEERAAEGPAAQLLGPGARDMLRLAGTTPGLISGILATNWDAVRTDVERYLDRLERLADELEEALGAGVEGRADAGRKRGEGPAAPDGADREEVDARPASDPGATGSVRDAILRRVHRAWTRLEERREA